ncbi:hypothetical protein B566_EDAN014645 [Ephemera danica]|nr:hypothetical protein B566_EDAN014645 [Ephemera danica]
METTLASLGLSPHPRLRLCLDVINLLTRNRIFCARLSRTPTVHLLLRMLERCDHQEGGKIQLRVCAASLATLHRLCTSKPGRMVLRSHNGLQLLQAFCTGCPEERNRDALVARACDIIGLCLENRVTLLPDGASSPARFPLPVPASNLYLQGERSGSSSRDTTPNSDEERTADDEDVELDDLPLPCDDSLSLSDGSDDEDSVKSLRGLSLEPPNPAEVLRDLHIISKIRSGSDPRRVYCLIASKVHSVIPFVKVAYPDMNVFVKM